MIDVHVITLPHERHEWFDKCVLSMDGEPITLHHVDGVQGNIGAGRAEGFSRGTHDLVSFVDPDDWVINRGFSVCLQYMKVHPNTACVYTRENIAYGDSGVVTESGSDKYLQHLGTPQEATEAHHLVVFRRAAIEPWITQLADYRFLPEPFLKTMVLQTYGLDFLDFAGYMWRKNKQGAHRTLMNGEECAAEFRHYFELAGIDNGLC